MNMAVIRKAVTRKSVVRAIAWFLAAVVLAGCVSGLGQSFLGISTLAAATGLSGGLAAAIGGVIGASGNPGVMLATAGLFAARLTLSLWIGGFPFPKNRTRNGTRAASAPGTYRANHARSTQSTRPGAKFAIRGTKKPLAQPVEPGDGAALETVAAVTTHGTRDKPGERGAIRTFDFPALLRRILDADDGLLAEELPLRLALAAVFALFGGIGSHVGAPFVPETVLRILVATALCPLAAYGFYAATARNMRYSPLRQAGRILTVALCAYALAPTRLFAVPALAISGIGLGALVGFGAAVVSGIGWGAAYGALYGVACGLCVSPTMAGAFGLAGIAAGIAGQFSPVGGIALSAAGGIVWSMAVGGVSGMGEIAPSFLVAAAVLTPFYAIDGVRGWIEKTLPSPLPLTDLKRRERETLAETALLSREKRLGAMSAHLSEIGAVLTGLAERVNRPTTEEAADWCREAVGLYCTRCPRREDCTETHYDSYAAMLSRMAQSAVRQGCVDGADVPLYFAGKCAAMSRILDEVNITCARRLGERRMDNRLKMTAQDYAFMGELLAESAKTEAEDGRLDEALSRRVAARMQTRACSAGRVAVYGVRHRRVYVHDIHLAETRMGGEELREAFSQFVGVPLSPPVFTLDGPVLSMEMHSEPRCRCASGSYRLSGDAIRTARANGTEIPEDALTEGTDAEDTAVFAENTHAEVSGDTICTFESGERTYMLLSDGMGSGKMASLASEVSAMFLDKMLSAGAGLEITLRMLNHILRANTGEVSTTVDLCELDRVTGEVKFVKSGAAPSYVIRGDSLFRLQSKTVPIGILRALDAELIRFHVEPGDVIVMVSDGVAKSFEDCPWLIDLLSRTDRLRGDDPTATAKRIAEEAVRHGAVDDVTAGVIQVA